MADKAGTPIVATLIQNSVSGGNCIGGPPFQKRLRTREAFSLRQESASWLELFFISGQNVDRLFSHLNDEDNRRWLKLRKAKLAKRTHEDYEECCEDGSDQTPEEARRLLEAGKQ